MRDDPDLGGPVMEHDEAQRDYEPPTVVDIEDGHPSSVVAINQVTGPAG